MEKIMGRHSNLPFHIYVNVKNSFLGPQMPEGVTRGIWHGVYSREHQILQCHVFLESGANWSGLPIHALSTTSNFEIDNQTLMPWTCMGAETEVFHSKYLEGLRCNIFKSKLQGRHTGIIIDWSDGYSRYPEEHKPLNLIGLDSGQFALIPNNFATFYDAHFVNEQSAQSLKFYKRNDKIFWEDNLLENK
jgi:hypothetical protein